MEGRMNMEFRLHSEGTNKNPCWGIAFRDRMNDPQQAIDFQNRPSQMEILLFLGPKYAFGIRPSFWNSNCFEFVDAQVQGGCKPIRDLFIHKLGFNVRTKSQCNIIVDVVVFNKLLRISQIQLI